MTSGRAGELPAAERARESDMDPSVRPVRGNQRSPVNWRCERDALGRWGVAIAAITALRWRNEGQRALSAPTKAAHTEADPMGVFTAPHLKKNSLVVSRLSNVRGNPRASSGATRALHAA